MSELSSMYSNKECSVGTRFGGADITYGTAFVEVFVKFPIVVDHAELALAPNPDIVLSIEEDVVCPVKYLFK